MELAPRSVTERSLSKNVPGTRPRGVAMTHERRHVTRGKGSEPAGRCGGSLVLDPKPLEFWPT